MLRKNIYIPQYGDLDPLIHKGESLPRTKSGAYQIACWSGWSGAHEFYLGRNLRGFMHLALTIVSVGFLFRNIWIGIILILLNAIVVYVAIQRIAKSSPKDSIYSGRVKSGFHPFGFLFARGLLWDTDLWKGKRPADEGGNP